jgi:hypothetical protein
VLSLEFSDAAPGRFGGNARGETLFQLGSQRRIAQGHVPPCHSMRSSLLTRRWGEMHSNFQYASTVRWHRATDLALPPTVKRRSGAPASHAISRDNPL